MRWMRCALVFAMACGGARPHATAPRLVVVGIEDAAPAGTGSIAGVVVDAANQPVVEVAISAASPAVASAQTAYSDLAGAFEIARLPAGHYELVVARHDHQHAFQIDVVAGKRTTTRIEHWPTSVGPPEQITRAARSIP